MTEVLEKEISTLPSKTGVGERIRLHSGKRFDSASRYIEERGDEPMAARKSTRVPSKYKMKHRV